MRRSAEIVVVGAGMFGSATAKYLSREGADVVVVGPFEPIEGQEVGPSDFGAFFDQARICRRLGWDNVWATLDSASLERFRDIEEQAGLQFFHEIGSLVLMPGEIANRTRSMLRQCRDGGVEIARLSRDSLRAKFPAIGLPDLKGGVDGLYERVGAGYIDPRNLVSAQLTLTAAAGGRHLPTTVVGLSRGDKGWVVQLRESGGICEIEATKVLLATGAFMNHNGLLPTRLHLAMKAFTEPNLLFKVGEDQLRALMDLPPIVVVDSNDVGDGNMSCYLLPPIRYPDGQWYVRIGPGMQPFVEQLVSAEDMVSWYRRQRISDRQRVFLSGTQAALLPTLDPLATRDASCIIEKTPTGYPFIGWLEDGLGVVTGGNGHGARGSDEIGRLAALMALGKPWDSTLARDMFAPMKSCEDSWSRGFEKLKPPFGLC